MDELDRVAQASAAREAAQREFVAAWVAGATQRQIAERAGIRQARVRRILEDHRI